MARLNKKIARDKALSSIEHEAAAAIGWLKRHATKHTLEGMARYAIPSDNALGVSVANIRLLAKKIGRNHPLALELWKTGCYEARMLACFVDDPKSVATRQMDRWCRDFDSWAICDTACFHLFDRTGFAWDKARLWVKSPKEFIKRAGFALMASLVAHDKTAGDSQFLALLPLIEQGACDERNFVKKAVNWALRAIGKRSPALNAAAVEVSERLASSDHASCRWVGKDALRELAGPAVKGRLKRRAQ